MEPIRILIADDDPGTVSYTHLSTMSRKSPAKK